METNETNPTPTPFVPPVPTPPLHGALELSFEAQTYLKETGKWAGFLGIVGFIGCGILLIIAIFAGTFFSLLTHFSPGYSEMGDAGAVAGFAGAFFSIILILADVLYFFFALYLYQFSVSAKKGFLFSDSAYITQALGKLKSFFKLAGIVTIVVLSLYALEIIVLILIGGIAALHR